MRSLCLKEIQQCLVKSVFHQDSPDPYLPEFNSVDDLLSSQVADDNNMLNYIRLNSNFQRVKTPRTGKRKFYFHLSKLRKINQNYSLGILDLLKNKVFMAQVLIVE